MYIDTVLFIIGALFTAALAALVVYLFSSRKKSRVFTEILRQESERFDAITSTYFSSGQRPGQSAPNHSPDYPPLAGRDTPYAGQNRAEAAGGGTDMLFAGGSLPARQDPAPRQWQAGAFDPYTVAGAYEIESEIQGGAMSRTFRVRSVKLGNPWFMKFIPGEYGSLANEVEILKLLNHVSLPKIIDVFHKPEGVYMIETLVEGVPLDGVGKAGIKISQHILTDWFEQIAQALNYLHRMKPAPVFHLDLKPGNIMVTHDNRLVLVDFGIARRHGEDAPGAITASYAAPEQFGGRAYEKYSKLIQERFGGADAMPRRAPVDGRADIYSLGVIMFELATGRLPTLDNIGALKSFVPDELSAIIRKCLAVDPAGRYRSADALLNDLHGLKGAKFRMTRMLLTRKLAAAAASLSLIISGGAFAGGYYIFNEESAAVISAQPEIVTVSLQQSSDFSVRKEMADGRVVYLDTGQITWESADDNIARIDGGRVSGMNEGRTVISGRYRNREISLTVRVVRPVDGLVDVSQRYEAGRYVTLFSGDSERVRSDGPVESANYISPESITAAGDGTVYVADAGEIRMISDGVVSTVNIPVSYIKAAIVRSYDNELYILSDPWQDGGGYHYALARIRDNGVEALYIADAQYTAVEDFDFGADGLLYFIDRNEGLGGVFLRTLDVRDVGDIRTLCGLPRGSASLAVADGGEVFIGNAETGVIQIFQGGGLEYFAGIEGDRAFIDGASPRFYSPQEIEYRDGCLYVWDFNTLRMIETSRSDAASRGAGAPIVAGECITLAGVAGPDFDMELDPSRAAAEDITLPFGSLMSFTVTNRGVLLTDPKRGVIWRIN